MTEAPPGARIEVTASRQRLRFARVHARPFTDRLVAKFDLPVAGWRERKEPERPPGAPPPPQEAT